MTQHRSLRRSLSMTGLVGFGLLVTTASVAAQVPAASPSPSAATSPGPSTLREQVLFAGPAVKERDRFTALSNLVATDDAVGWVERERPAGARRTSTRQRVVARHDGKIVRGPWLRGGLVLSAERRKDDESGRVVTRFVVTHARGQVVTRSFLSPRTLRPTAARWAPLPHVLSVADGERTLSATTEPGSGPAVSPQGSGVPPFVPPQCRVTDVSFGPLTPPLVDCDAGSLDARGSLLVLRYRQTTAPVPETGTSSSTALYDLARPELGWRTIGTSSSDKGGSVGIRDLCLLDDGAAVLTGSIDYYRPDDPSTWSVSFIPRDPETKGWTVPTPQFSTARYGITRIACGGSSIYVSYPRVTKLGGGKIRIQESISRLHVQ